MHPCVRYFIKRRTTRLHTHIYIYICIYKQMSQKYTLHHWQNCYVEVSHGQESKSAEWSSGPRHHEVSWSASLQRKLLQQLHSEGRMFRASSPSTPLASEAFVPSHWTCDFPKPQVHDHACAPPCKYTAHIVKFRWEIETIRSSCVMHCDAMCLSDDEVGCCSG